MILDRIYEGGPFFMVPIVFLLITILLLTIFGIVKKDNNKKMISLISSLSLFVLVWGFLGQAIGLIGAFDAIQSLGNITTDILAGGLKITFLPVVFGMFTFLIGRVGIIILTLLDKK
ncbi:MotA/TolQ/ExbB proton channel family protein [Flavobacterium jejuense]|uniref:MotA/TolQ/ExbB proton channel family protein n=1 Tax=Flavobacterium jejuense TaxID=1544455 RepID=A0ABX0IXI5_9FLAO|nr:MotA/TolQ/ExbB proton channel family protein [Flavobacterium jejuense]NHN26499.1 MotA/TolQ/ExbB proton channel family protein [Flavobacterium jejuense]